MRVTGWRVWMGIAALTSATACTYSPVKVREVMPEELAARGKDGQPKDVTGVPFYFPRAVTKRFVLTKLKREDGTFTKDCDPIPLEEQVIVPDYSRMYLIRQQDFWFGQNTFAVTLSNGILASVNSVRDPQVDEMMAATAGLAKEVGALGIAAADVRKRPGLPDCNDGKRAVD